jgi:phosphatidate cytidylyltransferase
MSLEWTHLTAASKPVLGPAAMIAALLAAVLAAAVGAWGWAVGLTVAWAFLVSLGGVAERSLAWIGAGILYVGLPSLALLWLRDRPDDGLGTVLWVLALAWAVDTGAYVAGRRFGGPKLAPRISPSKTWAGLAGGAVAAFAVGVGAATLAGANALLLGLVSAGLAFVEQAGDLMESAVKRHFHVKDAGSLIPGHGGLLDRVDGLVATLLAVAAMTLAAGRSPLDWQ